MDIGEIAPRIPGASWPVKGNTRRHSPSPPGSHTAISMRSPFDVAEEKMEAMVIRGGGACRNCARAGKRYPPILCQEDYMSV